eukprot:9381884-Ditylum_brightwellii.AAC.1
MKAVSEKCNDKTGMQFLWALNSNGLAAQVWAAENLPKMRGKPTMIMLDLPDQGGYYVSKEMDIMIKNGMKSIEAPGYQQQL